MNQPAHPIREAIQQANHRLQAAFGKGDARVISALYTKDAILLPTGSEPVQGTGAIAAFWEAALQVGIKDVKLETSEIDPQGTDTVIELGQYTLRGDGAGLMDRGKYIVIWKLIQGEWKVHRDIWNTSLTVQ